MRLGRFLLVPFYLLAVIPGAMAQDESLFAETKVPELIASENFLENLQFSIGLGLDEALRDALDNNLGFTEHKLDVLVANNAVTRAEAAFDINFNSSIRTNASRQTGRITDSGLVTPDQETDGFNYNASLIKKLGSGTEINLTTSADRLDSDFGLGTTARTSNTRVSLQITQPLLRNSGATANQAALETAKKLAIAAEYSLGRNAMQLTVDIESSYWELALAENVEQLRVDSVILARRLVDTTGGLYERGRKSRLDFLEAQNALAARQQDLITARFNRVRLAEALKLSISGDVDTLDAPLVTTTTIPQAPTDIPALKRLEELAILSRPDLLAARNRLYSSEISLAAARRNRLPQLNLVGSLETGGTDEQLSLAYDRLIDNQAPNWTLSVTFSMPFGNRAANSDLADASISRQRNAIQVAMLENDVRLDVRESFRSVTAAAHQLQIAIDNASTAAELLDAAEKRYQLGMIDLNRLLEEERDTTESGVTLEHRKHGVAKALTRLRLAVGTSEFSAVVR